MSNYIDKSTYSLVINSADKISGTNNDAIYSVNFQDFLPQNYDKYKVIFSAQTVGGNYLDSLTSSLYGSAKLLIDFNCRQYSWETSKKSQSLVLGCLQRDVQTTTTNTNALSTFHGQYPPRTITRPVTNTINVQIINTKTNTPLTDTTALGVATSDMTAYTIFLEFIPIEDSIRIANSTI